MPKNADSLNRSLFELLQSKGYDPTLLSTSGKETPTPEEAEVFQFNFVKDGEDYGKVTMSIDGLHKLVIYYDDDIANSEKETDESGDLSWYQLLNQLKRFAQKYQLSFELRNVSNLKHDMAKREYMKKKESIQEGYYPMGKKASYSDAVPSVKIVLQHTRQIEEGEQRYRNVAKIFLENEQGERFLAPTTKPGIARVYARHIAEGGQPHDERWNHINSLCEEYQKMAGFVRATRNGQFNESTQRVIAEGINHYQKLRESLGKLAGHRGYNAYFESWTPPLMEDETDTSNLNELFVQETVDPRIESVMPILARLSKNINEMSEVNELAEWADKLVESDDEEDTVEEATDLKSIPQEGRLDGSDEIDSPVANAITRRILMQRVDLLSKYGPEKVADAIATIADDLDGWIGPDDEIGTSDVSGWVKRVEQELSSIEEGKPGLWANIHAKRERIKHGSGERMRKPGSKGAPSAQDFKDAAKEDVEMEEGLGDVAKKVGGALKTGAKAVGKAIVGPDDDELLRDLKKKAGVNNPETGKPSMAMSKVDEVDLGQYDAVKAPLKGKDTSDWDKNFREKLKQYTKELDQRQKEKKEKSEKVDEEGVAEGEFAGDYKTGPEGQWRNKGPKANKPAKVGDLVGASESIQNTLDALTEMDKSEDVKGPEGKATPIKAGKAKKDFAKMFQKNIDKANKEKKDTDEKVKQHQVKESIQLDEGVMDSIKGIVGKIKAIPGIQKFIQAAQAKKAELIQAAQQSRNGQELIKNIQAAVGGQQAVAEGWGQKLSGGLVASAGGGLMAAGAEMFMRAWNAMGKPDLAQMMNDPGRDGQIVLALVTMLVLVGALSLFGGGHMFKQGLEKDVQPMREGQEDLDAILRIIKK